MENDIALTTGEKAARTRKLRARARKAAATKAAKPVVLTWAQIAHSAMALGITPAKRPGTKTAMLKLHKQLMATGRVRSVARGRYQLLV